MKSWQLISPPSLSTATDLADDLNNLGILLRERGVLRDAEQAYRRAIELGEQLVTEFSNPDVQINLAASYHNLGNVVRDQASRRIRWRPMTEPSRFLAPSWRRINSSKTPACSCTTPAGTEPMPLGQLGKHAEAIRIGNVPMTWTTGAEGRA